MITKHNLEVKLIDADLEMKKTTDVTYENLVEDVNLESQKKQDDFFVDIDESLANQFITQQIYYQENYTLKELHHIANYYDISKRKKRKAELIDDIVAFEIDNENCELVEQRKRLWFYLNEIKNDNYLSKFIILE